MSSNGSAVSTDQTSSTKQERRHRSRKLKKLVVKVKDATEQEKTKTMLVEHILQKLQSSKYVKTSQLIAAKRFQSGNILLQAATIESKERLERMRRQEKQLFESAKVLKQIFPVLVHDVRLDSISKGQKQQVLKHIARKKEKYHPLLGISKVGWLKWAKNHKRNSIFKQYSSLLVELSTPEAANKVVKKVLVERYQLKTCSRYSKAGTLL